MAMSTNVCVRFPPELDAAIRTRAELDGITPSEVIRAIVHRWVHGEAPSVDEGYTAARANALNIAHAVVEMAADQLPQNFDELAPFLEQVRMVNAARGVRARASKKQRGG